MWSILKGKQNHQKGLRSLSKREKVKGHPLEALKQLPQTYKSPPGLNLPRFSGGAVGYIGYDAVSLLEPSSGA